MGPNVRYLPFLVLLTLPFSPTTIALSEDAAREKGAICTTEIDCLHLDPCTTNAYLNTSCVSNLRPCCIVTLCQPCGKNTPCDDCGSQTVGDELAGAIDDIVDSIKDFFTLDSLVTTPYVHRLNQRRTSWQIHI